MLSVGRNTRLRMSNQQQSANKCTSLYPNLTLVYTVTKSCRKDYHKKKGRKVNTGYRETFLKIAQQNKVLKRSFLTRKCAIHGPNSHSRKAPFFPNYYCNFPIFTEYSICAKQLLKTII